MQALPKSPANFWERGGWPPFLFRRLIGGHSCGNELPPSQAEINRRESLTSPHSTAIFIFDYGFRHNRPQKLKEGLS